MLVSSGVFHQTHTHDILNCFDFKRMDRSNKLVCLKRNRICFSCLESGHVSAYCNNRNKCNFKDKMGSICGKYHHALLHDVFSFNSVNDFYLTQYNSITHVNKLNSVLLPIGIVKSKGNLISTLYDSGSNISLISHSLANCLGLRGTEIELSIIKVGNEVEK